MKGMDGYQRKSPIPFAQGRAPGNNYKDARLGPALMAMMFVVGEIVPKRGSIRLICPLWRG
jgi:hypothetical protein